VGVMKCVHISFFEVHLNQEYIEVFSSQ